MLGYRKKIGKMFVYPLYVILGSLIEIGIIVFIEEKE